MAHTLSKSQALNVLRRIIPVVLFPVSLLDEEGTHLDIPVAVQYILLAIMTVKPHKTTVNSIACHTANCIGFLTGH